MERIAHISRQVGSARRLRCISLQARATLQKICRLLVLLRAGDVAGRQSRGPRPKQASNIARASAAAASGQSRVSLCRARHERGGGEAGERWQQARGRAAARSRCCFAHAVFAARCMVCIARLVSRACCVCCGGGWRLGGHVQETTCDVKRGRGGRGGSGRSMGSSSPQRVNDGRISVVFSQLQGGFSVTNIEKYCKK